jgi:iron complex outermembrane recepter protein
MKSSLRMALLAGAAWAAVGAFSNARAQTAEAGPASPVGSQDAQSTTVGEIVVTASKREERLIDVPMAVQAIGAEQLEQSGATKVSDLVSAIPGASVVSNSTPGFETIQIRGVSSGTTGDGLVGYYVDETPFGIPNLQLTPPARLLDLERVEVIRGPSGTLYGQGSMGGTIKLVTAPPDSREVSGKLQAEYSSTAGGGDNYAVDGVVNLPLVQDRLAVRISAGVEALSGYAEAPELNASDVNDFDGRNLRFTGLWTPTPDLALTAWAWFIRNEQDFNNGLTPFNASTAPFFQPSYQQPLIVGTGGVRGYTDVDADLYSFTVDWELPFANLISNSSYIEHELDFVSPLLGILVNDSTFQTDSFTQEIRLTSLPGSPVQWIGGVFYRDAEILSDIFFYVDLTSFGLPGVKSPVINTLGPLTTESWSVFGEVSMELFGGKLVPLFGLRYFEDERSSAGLNRTTGLTAPTSAKWDSLNPRFNLKYNVTDDGIIFFNAAKGFRSGALQTPAQAAAGDAALGVPAGTIQTVVEPDELWTYELGTRWELAGGDVVVEAGVYHTEWKDVLVQFASAAVISIANGGDAEITGFDAGVIWRTPVEGLTLAANGNINDAEFTRVVGALSAATNIRVGGRIPNVPRSNVTVSADYERDMSWLGGTTLSLYGAYAFRDNQNDATVKGLRSGELNDLTLRAGLEKDGRRLEAFITNALDDDDPAVISSTSRQILYPRRVGVRLSLDF